MKKAWPKKYFVSIIDPEYCMDVEVASFRRLWLARIYVWFIRPFVSRRKYIKINVPAWMSIQEIIDYAETLMQFDVSIPKEFVDGADPGVGTSGNIIKTI